jgi:hypothetical protein
MMETIDSKGWRIYWGKNDHQDGFSSSVKKALEEDGDAGAIATL